MTQPLKNSEQFKYSPGVSLFQELKLASEQKLGRPSELIKSKIQKLRKEALLSLLSLQDNYKTKLRQLNPSKFASVSSFFPKESQSVLNRKESRKQDFINYYNQITSLKISETESMLARYWKGRINDLLLILKDRQALVHTEQEINENDFFQFDKNKVLVDFTKTLSDELEYKYRQQYLKELENHQEKNREKMTGIIKEIEDKQYKLLQIEKKNFFRDKSEEKMSELTFEEQEYLIDFEKSLRAQADDEIKETLESLLKEFDKVLETKYKEIDEQSVNLVLKEFETEFDNWENEVKQEVGYAAKHDQIEKAKLPFINKIQQEIKEKVTTQALGNQSVLYEEVHSELFNDFEEFRKRSENKTREKISKVEEDFQLNFCKQVYSLADKQARPIEINLKMNYHKKLDNMKQTLRKEMEKRFLIQYKNFKRTVELEKISYCQFKSNFNVLNKNLEKELKTQHSMKSKEKDVLKRKSTEPSFIKYKSTSETGRKTIETPLTLWRPSESTQKVLNFDDIKVLNKPLPPPELHHPVQRYSNSNLISCSNSKPGFSRPRIISPSLTEELFASLLGTQGDLNNIQGRSSSLSRCQSASLDKTQNKYEQLLEKHYKFIRPRK